MRQTKLPLKMLALVACLLCSMSAVAQEAYACYTSDNHTLTFYYDSSRPNRPGTTYDLNQSYVNPGWLDDGTYLSVEKVVFKSSFSGARPTSTFGWFAGMENLTNSSFTGLNYLKTVNVTDMSYMFQECSELTNLDAVLSYLNTTNVTKMSCMFYGCASLTSLDLSNFNTANVTNMSGLFANCYNLESINLSNFNTANVTDISALFYSCSSLTSLDLSSFNTAKVTSMYNMFNGCASLTSLDLSSFNTAKLTDMDNMFNGCASLTSLDLSSFNTAKVTDMDNMFNGCTALTNLDLSSFNTAQVKYMTNMFYDCSELVTVYAGDGWSTAAVTSSTDMFKNCTKIKGSKGTTYDANHVDVAYAHIDGGTSNPGYLSDVTPYAVYTPENTTLTFYCDKLRYTRPGTSYDLNRSSYNPGWYSDLNNRSVTEVVFDPSFAAARPISTRSWFTGMTNLVSITGMKEYLNTSEVTDMSFMFSNCSSLTSLDVSHFNTANVYTMWSMFADCIQLTSLDVSSFNTAKVTDMSYMFCGCCALTSLNLSSFNTANVKYMHYMFYDNRGLRSLNLSSFNTGNVKEMVAMFQNCQSLTSLDLSNFNTSNVTNIQQMFYGCSGLTSLDLSNFNTSNVTSMYGMFFNCSSLRSLDLSSFNTSQVTSMTLMFFQCSSLTRLDLSSFNTANVKYMDNMFNECSSLLILNLSSFNTSSVTVMSNMFLYCSQLTTIEVGNEWSTAAVTSSDNMFYNCTSLVGEKGTTYNYSHIDKAYAHIDGGPSNPGYLSAHREAYAEYTESNQTLKFYYDSERSLHSGQVYFMNEGGNVPGWYGNSFTFSITTVVFDPSFAYYRPTTTAHWFEDMSKLETIVGMEYLNTSEVTNMTNMFNRCKLLTDLDLRSFNTANVTDMSYMFNSCQGLTCLNVSSFNTANVTNMYDMFYGCKSLTSLGLGSFNTAQTTNMASMFYNCNKLKTIYVGDGWSTEAVTNSSSMFKNCTSLVGGNGTTYDANHVDKAYAHIDGGPSNPGYFTEWQEAYVVYTPSNTTMTFYCDDLRASRPGTSFDLNDEYSFPDWYYTGMNPNGAVRVVFDPSFAAARPVSTLGWFSGYEIASITGMEYLNTSKVITMDFMFYGNTTISKLDLSHFDTQMVTSMYSMFEGCSNLTTIYAGDSWSTDALTNSSCMFSNCTKLVGGMGTTYSASHTDAAYAHIDGGPSNPGYFTAKPAFTRGDVNGDGQVKIADVTALINYLLSGDASQIDLQAADCNEDGQIKISDVTSLINYLLSGAW